jgi:hypothetical protein
MSFSTTKMLASAIVEAHSLPEQEELTSYRLFRPCTLAAATLFPFKAARKGGTDKEKNLAEEGRETASPKGRLNLSGRLARLPRAAPFKDRTVSKAVPHRGGTLEPAFTRLCQKGTRPSA